MKVKIRHSISSLVLSLFLFLSCGEKKPSDPCCTFAELPATVKAGDGQGALQVEGSTNAYFYVEDETGKQVGYELLNHTLSLDPGKYRIKVNNTLYPLEIQPGRLAKCSTGTLMVSGNTTDYFYVMDTTGHQLSYESLGKSLSFFPGTYRVKVNETGAPVAVKLKELTEIKTGTLIVHGTTGEYYYVLDNTDKQLNYNVLEKPLAFLPGTYPVKVNKTTLQAHIQPGRLTELATGILLVKGLTEEYYYVTDTLGNALNYQAMNKPLAFFPGSFQVKVNNTPMRGVVAPGQITELVTGSLMLTGAGTEYYYVLDDSGNSLNYNSLNKSLSFFPSDYVVKIGGSMRKATVKPGELTTIDAFK
ncbi:MAG TPA: hypothetical protein VFO54_08385 [Chryseosolibacter sp.]|nr:hypothetical protein [Chryseosolibacter sp.]